MAKTITMNKMARVEAPAEDEAIAYQVVEFIIDFLEPLSKPLTTRRYMKMAVKL